MGRFVTALCRDREGNLWVGTEETGVWRYDPRPEEARRWTQFTRANTGGPAEPDGPIIVVVRRGSPDPAPVRRGSPDPAAPVARSGDRPQQQAGFLGDDYAYALACDKLGRVWVGHLNHGVSVYNGREWRNYDVLTGPLGERVFDIAICPADGDVWIATTAGLSRYRLDEDQWCYYTRSDGLPADDVQCLAFAPDGTLYAGTQCDGLAIAARDSAGAYRYWRKVQCKGAEGTEKGDAADLPRSGPPGASHKSAASPFSAPLGQGLPTNLVNAVLVARDGTVYVATPRGLALSADRGKTWRYVRGQDWPDKAKGLFFPSPAGRGQGEGRSHPPSPEQLAAAQKLAQGKTLLREDYCTCLAEDETGLICVGHRQAGFEVLDPATLRREYASADDPKLGPSKDYAFCMLVSKGCAPLFGWYGHGLTADDERIAVKPAEARPAAAAPPLPAPAAPPTATDLDAMLAGLLDAPRPARARGPVVVPLADDWRTQGDWLGRYGRYWACLCAICSPRDYEWGGRWESVVYGTVIGPHCQPNDGTRYWVHWLYTADRRSLELPPVYLDSRIVLGYTPGDKPRRQAEWDDHGEAYPMTHEGPNLYCTLSVPAGLFYLSLYDFNKDGHEGKNRFRDYRVSIREHAVVNTTRDIADFHEEPELAHARIRDFRGGVWKRFLVRGPASLAIEVARSGSFNTILAGAMLDLVDAEPAPYFRPVAQWQEEEARRRADDRKPLGDLIGQPAALDAEATTAARLANAMPLVQRRDPQSWAVRAAPYSAALLRWQMAQEKPEPRAFGAACYGLCLFPAWEETQRARGLKPARDIEKALRWDWVVKDNTARGRQVIEAYLGQEDTNPTFPEHPNPREVEP